MITEIHDCQIKPEYVEAILDNLESNRPLLEAAPGFVAMRVLKPREVAGNYLVLADWESPEDYQAWQESEACRQAHSDEELIANAFSEPPTLGVYDVF